MRARGMSQTDLAAAMGLSKSTMSRLMSGERKISAGELAVFASVLDVSVAELLGEAPVAARARSRQLALAARLSAGDVEDVRDVNVRDALARARELLELTDQLDRLVVAAPLTLAELPERPRSGRYVDQGTVLAKRVRTTLGLGDARIDDVSMLAAEQFGLAVAREPLSSDLLGLLITDEPTGRDGSGVAGAALALVNSDDTFGRQRFTVAHELGHLLFGDADVQFVDYRNATDLRETRANSFAAELLMPEGGVRATAAKLGAKPAGEADALAWAEQLVCDVATGFDSSVLSAIRRCNTLGYVDNAEKEQLKQRSAFQMLRATGHGDYEDAHGAGRNDIDPPQLLADKALYAYAEGLVGIGTLARLWKARDENVLRGQLAQAGWTQSFA